MTLHQLVAATPDLQAETPVGLVLVLAALRNIPIGGHITKLQHEQLTPGEIAAILLYARIVRDRVLTRDAVLVIFSELNSDMTKTMKTFTTAYENNAPVSDPPILALADRRYVRLACMPNGTYYDLVTLSDKKTMPVPFEGLSYNLVALTPEVRRLLNDKRGNPETVSQKPVFGQ